MLPVAMLSQMATAPGQTFGVSAFNPYLRDALSLSQSQFSGAYMLGTFLAALPQTYIGALMDRHGIRRTLAGVVALFGLACLWMSQVTGLVTLFVAFFFLRLLGQGAMGLLNQNTVAMWFHRRLGFASGIMTAGMALSLGAVPALCVQLIDAFGWRWAYALLGVIVWAMLLPLLGVVFRDRPEDVGQLPDGDAPEEEIVEGEAAAPQRRDFTLSQALRTRAYWILAGNTVLWSGIGTAVQFHMVQYFLDRGMTAADAATAFTALAAGMAATRFLGGHLADKLPLNLLAALAPLFQATGLVWMQFVAPGASVWLFAGCIGVGQGVLGMVMATAWVRYYGRAHLGKIRGTLSTAGVAGSSLGPFAMGFSYDTFGGYSEVLWVFAGLVASVSVVALFATPPPHPEKRA
jgi:sugar phosphate permease